MSGRRGLPTAKDAREFVLEMEARHEQCANWWRERAEDAGIWDRGERVQCPNYLCYRSCCFPPPDWEAALHPDLCHSCLRGPEEPRRGMLSKPCPTCGQPWDGKREQP